MRLYGLLHCNEQKERKAKIKASSQSLTQKNSISVFSQSIHVATYILNVTSLSRSLSHTHTHTHNLINSHFLACSVDNAKNVIQDISCNWRINSTVRIRIQDLDRICLVLNLDRICLLQKWLTFVRMWNGSDFE